MLFMKHKRFFGHLARNHVLKYLVPQKMQPSHALLQKDISNLFCFHYLPNICFEGQRLVLLKQGYAYCIFLHEINTYRKNIKLSTFHLNIKVQVWPRMALCSKNQHRMHDQAWCDLQQHSGRPQLVAAAVEVLRLIKIIKYFLVRPL